MHSTDVVVIGGGVIGCSVAYHPEPLGNDEAARLGIGLSLGQTENGNLLIFQALYPGRFSHSRRGTKYTGVLHGCRSRG
jgi:hypothetical protein